MVQRMEERDVHAKKKTFLLNIVLTRNGTKKEVTLIFSPLFSGASYRRNAKRRRHENSDFFFLALTFPSFFSLKGATRGDGDRRENARRGGHGQDRARRQ